MDKCLQNVEDDDLQPVEWSIDGDAGYMRETPVIIGAETGREGEAVEELDISRNPSKPISRPPSAPRLLDLSTTSPDNSVTTSKSLENIDKQITKSSEKSSVDETSEQPKESITTSNEDLQINYVSKMKINEESTVRPQDAHVSQSPEGTGQPETEESIDGRVSNAQVERKRSKIDEPICTISEDPTQNRKFVVNSKSNEEVEISQSQDPAVVSRTESDEEKVTSPTSGNNRVASSSSNNTLSPLNQIDPIAEGSYGFLVDSQSVRSTNNVLDSIVEPRSKGTCTDPDVDGSDVDKVPFIIRPITRWSLEAASGADEPINSNERCSSPRAKSATDVLEVREFKHLWMMTPEPPKAAPSRSEESMIGRGVIPIAPETTTSGNEQDDAIRPPPSVSVASDSITEPFAAAEPSAPVVLPNLAAAMNLIVPALKRNSWLKEPTVTVPDDTDSVQTSQSNNVSKETATPVSSTEIVSESLDQPVGSLTERTSGTRTQETPSKSKAEPNDQVTNSGNKVTGNAISRSQTPRTSDEKPAASYSMIARGYTTAKHVYDMLSLNKNLQIPTVIPLPVTPVPSPAPRRRRDPASYRYSTPRTPPERQQAPQRPHRPRPYEGMPHERRGHRRSDGSRRRSRPPRPPAPLPANRPRRDRPSGPPRLPVNCS